MRIILVLVICATGSAATCLTMLNGAERDLAMFHPGRVVKWNRQSREFETIEVYNQNLSSICSADYNNNPTNRTIVISGHSRHPYLVINPDLSLTGYLGDIWTTLEKAMKFRTDFRPPWLPPDIILMRGEADAWLEANFYSAYNDGCMVFAKSIYETGYSLFTMIEGEGVSKLWYTGIFSRGLWVGLFIFVVGTTGILLVMYRFEKAARPNYEECNNQLAMPSFSLLNILGAMTGQGFQEIPTAWSLRMITLSVIITGMFMSCGFGSSLTSYLAISDNTLHLKNLADVAKAKTYTICVRYNYAYDKKMALVDPETWKNRIIENCLSMENELEFRDKLCQPGVIYTETLGVFLSVYKPIRHKCHIAQIPGKYWNMQMTFLHARGSPHRHIIDKYLLRLRSAGILQYLNRKWIVKEWPTSQEHQLDFTAVEYAHVHLLLLGLVAMMFVSGIICILENIWFSFESSRAKKKSIAQFRYDHRNYFLPKPRTFLAVQLDPTSRRLWTTNRRN